MVIINFYGLKIKYWWSDTDILHNIIRLVPGAEMTPVAILSSNFSIKVRKIALITEPLHQSEMLFHLLLGGGSKYHL